MLTVWSRSLGGCGGRLREKKQKIFPAVSASVFTCGLDDNTLPNFSWAIIFNSSSSRHRSQSAQTTINTHTHTNEQHAFAYGAAVVATRPGCL